MLPIRDFEPAFTPYFATPHGLDLARAAELYGLEMREVDAAGDLTDAVADALREDGVRILRIRTDRDVNLRRHQETRALVERRVVDYLSNGSKGD